MKIIFNLDGLKFIFHLYILQLIVSTVDGAFIRRSGKCIKLEIRSLKFVDRKIRGHMDCIVWKRVSEKSSRLI